MPPAGGARIAHLRLWEAVLCAAITATPFIYGHWVTRQAAVEAREDATKRSEKALSLLKGVKEPRLDMVFLIGYNVGVAAGEVGSVPAAAAENLKGAMLATARVEGITDETNNHLAQESSAPTQKGIARAVDLILRDLQRVAKRDPGPPAGP